MEPVFTSLNIVLDDEVVGNLTPTSNVQKSNLSLKCDVLTGDFTIKVKEKRDCYICWEFKVCGTRYLLEFRPDCVTDADRENGFCGLFCLFDRPISRPSTWFKASVCLDMGCFAGDSHDEAITRI